MGKAKLMVALRERESVKCLMTLAIHLSKSMKAEIIAVGTELLTPDHLDTNSLFLTDRLNQAGFERACAQFFDIVRSAAVPDSRRRLYCLRRKDGGA